MTINEIQDQIVADMASLDGWVEKYAYLVVQGRLLEPLDDRFKVEANLISGCQSKVWVLAKCMGERVEYGADSDALITRGMIALLLKVLNHQVAQDIVDADLYFIQKTGLGSNLSPARADGLVFIVRRMKQYAETYVKRSWPTGNKVPTATWRCEEAS